MVDSKVAKIIKKHFPNIKLWACLRNPVERAYSDWLACKRFKLKETYPFEIAFFKNKNSVYRKGEGYRARGYYYKQLKPYFDLFPKKNIKIVLQEDIIKSPERIAREFYKFLGVDENFIPPSLKKKINKSTETKYKFLRKFINLIAESSHKLEKGVLGKFTFFLKRKTKLGKIFNKINDMNTKEVQKPKLNPKINEKLKKEYLEDIIKLEKLIKRDLSEWKK